MNRINALFQTKPQDVLSIYFTAGHPDIGSTVKILEELESNGVDMVEIGMPFSDPLADGPVIQDSDQKAILNGMTIEKLFSHLHDIRKIIHIPLLLMGYINPVLHFGFENFCKKCSEVGIDGIILPDLPLEEFLENYKQYTDKYKLHFIFLITPQTSEERIRLIDSLSEGFIYMVSSSSTTGIRGTFNEKHIQYFQHTKSLNLKNPLVVGFGITNRESFTLTCNYANGAIIGTAFVKMLDEENPEYKSGITNFIRSIKQ